MQDEKTDLIHFEEELQLWGINLENQLTEN